MIESESAMFYRSIHILCLPAPLHSIGTLPYAQALSSNKMQVVGLLSREQACLPAPHLEDLYTEVRISWSIP